MGNNLLLKTDVPAAAAGTPAIAQSGENRQPSSELATDDPNLQFAQVLANPSYFYGKTMVIEGKVDTVLSANSFTIGSPLGENKPLLIMAEPGEVEKLTPGNMVRIRGTLDEFDKESLERRHNVRLADNKFSEFNGGPALTATEVSSASGGENRDNSDRRRK